MGKAGTAAAAGSSNNHQPAKDCVGLNQGIWAGGKHDIPALYNGTSIEVDWRDNAVPPCPVGALSKLCLGYCLGKIDGPCFKNESNLIGEIKLPKSLTYIGTGAFEKSGPIKIDFSQSNLNAIQYTAFLESKIYDKVILPQTLQSLGLGAFKQTDVEEVFIPKSLALTDNPDNDGKDPDNAGKMCVEIGQDPSWFSDLTSSRSNITGEKFYWDNSKNTTSNNVFNQFLNDPEDWENHQCTDIGSNDFVQSDGVYLYSFSNFCSYLGEDSLYDTFWVFIPFREVTNEEFELVDRKISWGNPISADAVLRFTKSQGAPTIDVIDFADNFITFGEIFSDGQQGFDELFIKVTEGYCSLDVPLGVNDVLNGWGQETFYECNNLKKIVIEEGIEFIPRFSFAWCENASIGLNDEPRLLLPKTIVDVGVGAFIGNDFEKVVFDQANVTVEIGFDSFRLNPLNEIVFDGDPVGHVKIIQRGAFSLAKNAEGGITEPLYLPKNIEYIGDGAFENSLNHAELHFSNITNNNLVLGENSFSRNKIKRAGTGILDLHGVRTIEWGAFSDCEFDYGQHIRIKSVCDVVSGLAFDRFDKTTDLMFFTIECDGFNKPEFEPNGKAFRPLKKPAGTDSLITFDFTWSNVRGAPAKSGTITLTGENCGGFVQEDWEEQGFGPASRGLQMDIVFTGDVDASGFVTGDIKYAWAISYTESSSNGDYWYALSDIKDSPYDFNEATFTLYGSTDPYSLIPDPNSPYATAIAGTLTVNRIGPDYSPDWTMYVPEQHFCHFDGYVFREDQDWWGETRVIPN